MTDIASKPLSASRPAVGTPASAIGSPAGPEEQTDAMSTKAPEERAGISLGGGEPRLHAKGTLSATVEQLNGIMQSIRRELHFSVDNNSGRTVIKVIDAETHEVIRLIPPEETEQVVQNLDRGALLAGTRA